MVQYSGVVCRVGAGECRCIGMAGHYSVGEWCSGVVGHYSVGEWYSGVAGHYSVGEWYSGVAGPHKYRYNAVQLDIVTIATIVTMPTAFLN